jgi:tetratricopeptide (TPR) repeat protein
MYRHDRLPGGSHHIYETTWERESADVIFNGAAAATGWIIGSGISGARTLIYNSNDRRLMRRAKELDAASETDDVARFLQLSTEFTRRYPKEAYGFAAHATALMAHGRNAEAVSTAEHAVALGYEPVLASMMRFQAYYAAGRTAEAIQECTSLVRHPEVEPRCFGLMGRAKLLLDLDDPDLEQAFRDANEAVSLSPEGNTYAVRAQVYWKMGELKKCSDDYSRAIQLDPDNPDLLESRAIVYDELGMGEEAKRDRSAAQALVDRSHTSQRSASSGHEMGQDASGASGPPSPCLPGVAVLAVLGIVLGFVIFVIGIAAGDLVAAIIGLLIAGPATWWFVRLYKRVPASEVEEHGPRAVDRDGAPSGRRPRTLDDYRAVLSAVDSSDYRVVLPAIGIGLGLLILLGGLAAGAVGLVVLGLLLVAGAVASVIVWLNGRSVPNTEVAPTGSPWDRDQPPGAPEKPLEK